MLARHDREHEKFAAEQESAHGRGFPRVAIDSAPAWQPGALTLFCVEMNDAGALPSPIGVRERPVAQL